MPSLSVRGVWRKILNTILCLSLVLQSGSVAASVYSVPAPGQPSQISIEHLSQVPQALPLVTPSASAPPMESELLATASTASEKDLPSFTDTEIGFQSRPVPPPTLSGLPNPPTTQPVSLTPASSRASAAEQADSVLQHGWNLISIPDLITDTSPAAVLAPIAGHYSQVYAYDGCDTADPWKLYDPANPGASDLTRIDQRIGLWIQATAVVTLPFASREPPTTTLRLCTGWNLIGMPVKQARPVRNALSSIDGRYTRVFGYELADGTDPWEVYDVSAPEWADDLQQMRPGHGYWVLARCLNTSDSHSRACSSSPRFARRLARPINIPKAMKFPPVSAARRDASCFISSSMS